MLTLLIYEKILTLSLVIFPSHIQTNSEFRIGNVREQSLTEICRKNSLLVALTELYFQALERQEPKVSALTKP